MHNVTIDHASSGGGTGKYEYYSLFFFLIEFFVKFDKEGTFTFDFDGRNTKSSVLSFLFY